MQEQEYKLNGGETLIVIDRHFARLRLPHIFQYEVLANPTSKRAKMLNGSNEILVNRFGYKRNNTIFFDEINGRGRSFRLIDSEIKELQNKLSLFSKIKQAFDGDDLFYSLSVQQMAAIIDIVNETTIQSTEKA
jgi:hypothetical protein